MSNRLNGTIAIAIEPSKELCAVIALRVGDEGARPAVDSAMASASAERFPPAITNGADIDIAANIPGLANIEPLFADAERAVDCIKNPQSAYCIYLEANIGAMISFDENTQTILDEPMTHFPHSEDHHDALDLNFLGSGRTPMNKGSWLITGISRGLGRALARNLLARGINVIGTTRDGASDLASGNGQLTILTLEMTDAAAIGALVDRAFASGPVDVIVNNAGYGLLSSVEQATEEEIGHVMEVNFHGPRRIIQAALPHLRRQQRGHIVNITSIAGIAAGPGSGYYAAAKYALEGLSRSLAQEVEPLGICVTCVEPGAFRTDFLTDHSLRTSPDLHNDYRRTAGASAGHLAQLAGRQAGDPEKAANAIIEAILSANPPLHLVLGPDAIRRAEEMLTDFAADLNVWRSVSMATDHDDVDA